MTSNTYITKIGNRWFAYEGDFTRGEVYPIGMDVASGNDRVAPFTKSGIKKVSSPSPSRNAAYQKAKNWGRYDGELELP